MAGVQDAAKHAMSAMSAMKSCEVEKPQPNRKMLQAVRGVRRRAARDQGIIEVEHEEMRAPRGQQSTRRYRGWR
jgi:hypothetical protein